MSFQYHANTKENKARRLQWILLSILLLFYSTLAEAAPNRCAELFSRNNSVSRPANVATTTEILGQLSTNAGQKYRSNPTQVEIDSLEIGREYYVTPAALRGYPSISRKIKEPIRMRVVQVVSASKQKTWKGQSKVVYLESPETGRVAIESWRLSGDIFSEKDYTQYAPFTAGEYVQIGADYSSSNVYKIVANPENTITFSGNAATFIGKFIRIYDDNNYVVQVRAINHNVPPTEIRFYDGNNWVVQVTSINYKLLPTEIIVPRYETYGLTSGTITHFKNAMKGLLSLPIAFKSEELVRYRKADGTIALATFVRSNGRYMTVKDEFNNTVYVSSQSVFRYVEGEPHTAIYNADWIQAHFQKPSDLVRQFLDGAGKLTSLSDFAELPVERKILTLMKYLKTNVTWTKGAISGETAGLRDFNEILCAGAGVCRHLSVLMATMLSELGYSPRVTKYIEQGEYGHVWVEVDVRGPNGQVKTLVVDPSNGDFVKSFSEVSAAAAKDKNSIEASWYVKPGREFLVVQPQ